MNLTGLTRLAAAGVAVLAAASAGLVALPAAASTAPSKPVVSAGTPMVFPRSHNGACPVTVTFSAKVKVKVNGRATVAYRWLRGDGSKSKVKTQVVRGKGVKTVILEEKATFKKGVKGWQALQVLSPRKVTTKKSHFSVSCARPVPVKRPAYAKAFVHVPDYAGVCPPSGGVTARGVIKVGRPGVVKYRWIHNGKVVDSGTAKVFRDKKVSYTFKPSRSHSGWVRLDIVSPRHGVGDRDAYRVWCKKPPAEPAVTATASVTAPENYAGTCPIDRTFKGTVTVDRIGAGTTVRYRWAGPNFQSPAETLSFAQGDPLSKEVSHTVTVTDAGEGEVHRWIEILSPNSAQSNTGVVTVDCQALNIEIIDLRRRIDSSVCGTPGYGPAVALTAGVRVNGPVRVEYEWEIDSEAGMYTVPGFFEASGPSTVDVAHRIESSPITAADVIRVRFRITSHDVRAAVSDFTPPACPASS